jgi:hypothetical protein
VAAHARVPHPDLAFYLYAARRVLDGAVLYRDVVEINPPLIIWLNLPAAAVARLASVPDIHVYRALVSLLVGGVLVFSHRIFGHLTGSEGFGRAPYLLLVPWFALFPLAGDDFGQREHLLLAFIVPYLLVSAARQKGVPVPSIEAVGAGVLAGLGLALKPHFVIAWLAIEAVRRTRSGVEQWRVTPELLATAVTLVAYLVAVTVLTPDYFRVVRILGPAYTKFMARPLVDVTLLAPAAPRILFAVLAFLALRRSSSGTPAGSLLAAATLGAYAAAALQRKGFSYHYYPALALGFTLLVAIAVSTHETRTWVQRTYVRLARAVVATIVIVGAGTTLLGALRPGEDARALADLAAAVRTRSNGRPVGVLSYTINSAFPLMNDAGTTLASRFPCLWPLATSYWDSLTTGGALRYHTPPEMGPAERLMWDAVAEDLIGARPGLLLILRPGRDVPHNGLRRLNYVAYFGRRSELADFFSGYQLIDRRGEYLLYERAEAETARVGPPPSPDPGLLEAPRPAAPAIGLGLLDASTRAEVMVFGLAWVGLLLLERRGSAALSVDASNAV